MQVRKVQTLLALAMLWNCIEIFGQTSYARKIENGGSPAALIGTKNHGHLLVSTDLENCCNTFLVRRVDSTGKRLWQRQLEPQFPIENDVYHVSAAGQLSDGTFILAGGHQITLAPDFLWSSSPLLIKLASDGRIKWQKQLNMENGFNFQSVVPLDDGFAAAGTSVSVFFASDPSNSIIVSTFDSPGNRRWTKLFQLKPYVFSAGYVHSNLKLIGSNNSNLIIAATILDKDSWRSRGWLVFKIDEHGNIIWSKILGHDNLHLMSAAISSDDTSLLLIGYSSAFSSGPYVYAVELSSAGEFKWKRRFAIKSQPTGASIVTQSPGGGFVIGGDFGNARGFVSEINTQGKISPAIVMNSSPQYMTLDHDGGYAIFAVSTDDPILMKTDSKFDLPRCGRFGRVHIDSLDFGSLKIASVNLQSVAASVSVKDPSFRSTIVQRPDSVVCP